MCPSILACPRSGGALGSGTMLVMDESVCAVDFARSVAVFFAHESCGQCTPCREGTPQLLKTLTRIWEGQGQARRPGVPGEVGPDDDGRLFLPFGPDRAGAAVQPAEKLPPGVRGSYQRQVPGRGMSGGLEAHVRWKCQFTRRKRAETSALFFGKNRWGKVWPRLSLSLRGIVGDAAVFPGKTIADTFIIEHVADHQTTLSTNRPCKGWGNTATKRFFKVSFSARGSSPVAHSSNIGPSFDVAFRSG